VITLANLPVTVVIAASSMVVYAFLIGYMLSEQPTHRSVAGIGFGIAMAAHFIGLDHFYRDLQPRLYDTPLRYLLAAAIYVGWLLGIVAELPDLVYALLFALLAGGLMDCHGSVRTAPHRLVATLRRLLLRGDRVCGADTVCGTPRSLIRNVEQA